MSKNPLIKYYEVLNDASIYELDDLRRVALPAPGSKGKVWKVGKGQYVKSFGQIGKYKYPEGKAEMLLLVNGSGVNMKDLRLYADDVDDCGCDGNPVAKPSDLEKLNAPKEDHQDLDKESAYMGKPKRKFDKWAIVGFFLGAAILGIAVWIKTKDKKKTAVSAAIGAVLGLVVGYFIGKRGESKQDTLDSIDDIERDSDADTVEEVKNPSEADKADKKEFLQLGQSYDFVLPNSVYAMLYGNSTFYVARDKNKNRITLNKGEILKGKLIEVAEPQFFIPDPKSKKVIKIKSKKPLPFLDLGNKLYIPLSVVDPASIITTQEAMDYLSGDGNLSNEIYIKGRYAGKRVFNLMYMPSHDSAIRAKFGKRA